jgi:hypothetical protein
MRKLFILRAPNIYAFTVYTLKRYAVEAQIQATLIQITLMQNRAEIYKLYFWIQALGCRSPARPKMGFAIRMRRILPYPIPKGPNHLFDFVPPAPCFCEYKIQAEGYGEGYAKTNEEPFIIGIQSFLTRENPLWYGEQRL